jgi:hypothetical protein
MKKASGLGLGTRIAIASILLPCGIAAFYIGVETLWPSHQALQLSYQTNGSLNTVGTVLPAP